MGIFVALQVRRIDASGTGEDDLRCAGVCRCGKNCVIQKHIVRALNRMSVNISSSTMRCGEMKNDVLVIACAFGELRLA